MLKTKIDLTDKRFTYFNDFSFYCINFCKGYPLKNSEILKKKPLKTTTDKAYIFEKIIRK